MYRYLLFILCLLFASVAHSQELSRVSFAGATTLSSCSFTTDQGIVIKISDEGRILEWGTDKDSRRYNYIPGQLEQYLGRVDYYGKEADSIFIGKVKSIGTCMISYYPASETAAKAGKLKFLGRTSFDYYDSYENASLRGKIKFAGTVQFNYYSSYENEAFSGKPKLIGNTPIAYYSSYDRKEIKGKIKSIGSFNYNWPTSNSIQPYQGLPGNGLYVQNVNGITYILY